MKTKLIVFLTLPDTSPLNLFGAAEVFAEANRCGHSGPCYEVKIVPPPGRFDPIPFTTFFSDEQPAGYFGQEIDTLLIAGGLEPCSADCGPEFMAWLRSKCLAARRFGALCSGTLLLADAGLLDDKKISVHWSWSNQMSKSYPSLHVMSDRIFVRDGNCYTSAGAASAIDLALALVAEDVGEAVASEIAKRMLLFLRRPGGQSQCSETLLTQRANNQEISKLLIWMADNFTNDLSIHEIARRAAMSTRNFGRCFLKETGKTPGRHLSDLRLEAAKTLLIGGSLSLEEVSKKSGFNNTEALRRNFKRRFGTSPGQFRRKASEPTVPIVRAVDLRVTELN